MHALLRVPVLHNCASKCLHVYMGSFMLVEALGWSMIGVGQNVQLPERNCVINKLYTTDLKSSVEQEMSLVFVRQFEPNLNTWRVVRAQGIKVGSVVGGKSTP